MMYGKRPEEILEDCKTTNMKILQVLGQYVPKDKITIDIGAGIGTTAVFFNKLSKAVHCFEPAAQHLRELESYNLENVVVHPIALGDSWGLTPFYFNYGASSIVTPYMNGGVSVPIRTLDSFGFTNVGFIKIDVEGAELKVLKGAINTIEREHPNILIEIIPKQLNHSPLDIFSFLEELGYIAYYYDNGLVEMNYKDVVPLPLEKQEEIGSYDFLFIYEPNM